MSAGLVLAGSLVAFPERYCWHGPSRTAVASDLHLGFEEALVARGNAMPEFSFPILRESWRQIVAQGPQRVVLAGDLFHSRTPGPEALRQAQELLAALPPECRVAITPGNHDPAPEKIAGLLKRQVEVGPFVRIDGWAVAHGHAWPADAPAGDRIVGHQHPAVVLRRAGQQARMPCFAQIEDHGIHTVVLPAFSPAPLGTNLLSGGLWILDIPRPSPRQTRVAGIAGDKVLDFGTLERLSTLP